MESQNNQNRITRNAEETKLLFEKLSNYDKENKSDSIPSSPWMKDIKNLFVLRAQGINMEPRIFDGDYLIVHEQSDARTGQIAIFRIGKEFTCKRLRKDETGIWILPDNPNGDFKPAFFPYEDKENFPEILGVVIEIRSTHI